MEYFILYLAAISILSVIICIGDKIAAKHNKKRVMEKTLFLISALGGAAAMYITMRIIRHKTKHNKFMIGLPVIIVLQAILIIVILLYLTGEIRC